MDIDATRTGSGKTREDFLRAMRNRCFCCGGANHMKQQCGQKETICNYCARKGHLDRVCQDKFLGLEKNRGQRRQGQRVAATSNDYFTLFPSETIASTSYIPTPAPAPAPTPANPDISAQLVALQEAMTKQATILATYMQKDF